MTSLYDGHTDTLVEHQAGAYQALGFGSMTEHQRRYVMRWLKAALSGPAATAGANDRASGDWSFLSTADGKNQWAYKGHPLYRYAKDTSPGDMNGDRFKGMWHVVKA